MKKKLLSTSIAATLVLGSVAGLPLSANGVAQKLGLTNVVQAGALDTAFAKVEDLYSRLTDEEKATIAATKQQLQELEFDAALIAPIWNPIDEKINATEGEQFDNLSPERLFQLFSSVVFVSSKAELEEVIAEPSNRAVVKDLARLAGVAPSNNDQAAAQEFAVAAEAALETYFKANMVDLVKLYIEGDIEQLKDAMATVLNDVLEQELQVSQLLSELGVTGEAIGQVYSLLGERVDSTNASLKALAAAYGRTKTTITLTPGSTWRLVTPSLNVFGQKLSGAALTWTIDSDVISFADGQFKLADSRTTTYENTHAVEAKIGDVLLFKGDATFKFLAPSAPVYGGGGGGGGGMIQDVVAPDASKVEANLSKAAESLAQLVKDAYGNGLALATSKVEQAIREAAVIDISKTVKIEKDIAKPAIDGSKLEDAFKEVAKIAKSAKDKLAKEVPGAAVPKVIATLDLGKVDATQFEIPLSKDIVDKAKANGIDMLAVKVNNIVLAIDLKDIQNGVTVSIKENKSTGANAATDTYDLSFNTDKGALHTFTHPVEVRILNVNTAGKDAELLAFAKVEENGTLTFKGGRYDSASKQFAVMNKSFSSYVVVENKLTFGDVESVKQWAGRQIQVAAAKGIIDGRAANEFVPNASVTRAEFAKLIVKTFGLEDANATESFSDVSDADWFKPYVAAAVQAGIVNGRTDTSFDPNANVTRAEMATMAARAMSKVLGYEAVASTKDALEGFADAEAIHESLQAGVAQAAEQGIVVGEEGSRFNPNADSTRAQAAVVIYRLMNK